MTTATVFGLLGVVAATLLAYDVGEQAVERDDSNGRVAVVYWEKWTGSEADAMRKVVDDFNRSQSRIRVQYLSISGVESKTMLATAGGNPPDVAGLYLDQVVQFSDAKALTDLTGMVRSAGIRESDYIGGYWEALNVKGHLYALPSTPATIALHVRTDLMPPEADKASTFPKTVEEFDDLMFRISTKSPDGGLKEAGFLPGSPGWWNWAWADFFGGSVFKDGRLAVDSPEDLRAFEWIEGYAKRFGSKAVQSFQSGFGGFASPQDPFLSGKTATEFNGTWKANYVNLYKPGLRWFAVPFPHPAGRPDLADRTILNQDVLTIPRGAKHAKEAFEFIRYVQRQDVMEGLCSAHGKNSPLARVSPAFFAHHPNPEIRLFDRLARSSGAFSQPQVGIFPQINAEMNVAFEEVNTGVKTPKQALHDAQIRLQLVWNTYRAQVLGE